VRNPFYDLILFTHSSTHKMKKQNENEENEKKKERGGKDVFVS
jgi:hypothetical protein